MTSQENDTGLFPFSFYESFYPVRDKLNKILARFSERIDPSLFNDLLLLYLLTTKKFLDHREPSHLSRIVLSIYTIQKKLLKVATLYSHTRHLEIRWLPTKLHFPFSTQPVLGCLVGFNVMSRYELFDEENILLALQKHLPELKLVKESSYCHNSQHKNLKIFYLEIEKKNGKNFSLSEQTILKNNLQEKIRKSIQPLSPSVFVGFNDEETYKNLLVLSQEIQSINDLPQANISLEQQTGKEIIFRITLVHTSPFHHFSLKEKFIDAVFVLQRSLIVKHLENHPIEGHLFSLHFPRDISVLRSDGSLDFYEARKRVVALLRSAIGEFRDYNGGVLVNHQGLLQDFKECHPEIASDDPELMEAFFYAITPLEKQILLGKDIVSALFSYYIENWKKKLPEGSYSLNTYETKLGTFFILHGNHPSLAKNILTFLQEHSIKVKEIAYNLIENPEGVFFNSILQSSHHEDIDLFIQAMSESLERWHKKISDRQELRIGLEYSVVSLDPRIGGEAISGNILRLLFEGLTRFDQNGNVELAIAQSIEVSFDKKQYLFKLRPSFWNDGSPVTAYDFEYTWNKILSPDFKTFFAYLFYPIKNAKEAKQGLVSPENVGIRALDDLTLRVELVRPTSYFLQLTSHPLYSPVNRLIDQKHPEWPYQCEKHYPCNGPFQLKINQPNQGYQLIKNPVYWDAEQIILDQITLTQTNPAQAIHSFRNKEIDWIGNPFGNWNPLYISEKKGRIISIPNVWVCWLVFNTQCFPFSNCKIRQAFSYAIRREQFVNNDFLALNPAYSPIHSHHRKHLSAQFPETNPEKACQLFSEGLQELGIKKEDLPDLHLIFLEKGIREYSAQCLQEQMQQVLGISFDLKPLPWSELFGKMTQGNFQLGLMQWISWINDPVYTLDTFRSTDQEVNFSKWENPDFQRIFELAEQETNPFLHSSYLLKSEEILCQEMPIIPLFYSPSQAMICKNLQTSKPNFSSFFNIAKNYFKQKENQYVSNFR
jgi:oligopeptide transport system substrate-binding protein